MAIEKPKRKIIIIDSVEPPCGDYSGWIDTATRKLKVCENGQWVEKVDLDDPNGVTGTIRIANYTLVFEKGILKSYA